MSGDIRELAGAAPLRTHNLDLPAKGESIDEVLIRWRSHLEAYGMPNNLGDWLAVPNRKEYKQMKEIMEPLSMSRMKYRALFDSFEKTSRLPSHLRGAEVDRALIKLADKPGTEDLKSRFLSILHTPDRSAIILSGSRKQIGNPCTEASAAFLKEICNDEEFSVDKCVEDGEKYHSGHTRNMEAVVVINGSNFSPFLEMISDPLSGPITEESMVEVVNRLASLREGPSGALITAQGKTYALAHVRDHFYVFDSHGNELVNPDAAYCMIFNQQNDMIDFLIRLVRRTETIVEGLSEADAKAIDADPEVNGFIALFVSVPTAAAARPTEALLVDCNTAAPGDTLQLRRHPDWTVDHPMLRLEGTSLWQTLEGSEMPIGCEYKIVLITKEGDVKWEQGANRVFTQDGLVATAPKFS